MNRIIIALIVTSGFFMGSTAMAMDDAGVRACATNGGVGQQCDKVAEYCCQHGGSADCEQWAKSKMISIVGLSNATGGALTPAELNNQ